MAAAFLPFASQYATVLRLPRLLRVLRLVRALPKLQLLVGALLKSIPSMAYVGILMFLLFYVYAVAGVFLWGENDPIHFSRPSGSTISSRPPPRGGGCQTSSRRWSARWPR